MGWVRREGHQRVFHHVSGDGRSGLTPHRRRPDLGLETMLSSERLDPAAAAHPRRSDLVNTPSITFTDSHSTLRLTPSSTLPTLVMWNPGHKAGTRSGPGPDDFTDMQVGDDVSGRCRHPPGLAVSRRLRTGGSGVDRSRGKGG